MENLTIHGINENGPKYCEAIGISKVFAAYAEYCVKEEIMYNGVGFNPNSGYVYIALENGVTICSMLGREVEYLVTNFDTGNEYFFDTYEEAITFEVDAIN
jgi:hypothetical protein